jgi:thiol-disulfide isomerase/thioredoxin
MKRQHFNHQILINLLLLLGYHNTAARCAAFVFPGKFLKDSQSPRSSSQLVHDSFDDFHSRRRLCEADKTALHETSLKFKNFDVMLNELRDQHVVVYFSSNACGSCKLQRKELADIQNQFLSPTSTTRKKILMIDADLFPQVCLRYDVAKLPCILLINNGEVLLRLDGFTTAEDIMNRIQKTTILKGFCP